MLRAMLVAFVLACAARAGAQQDSSWIDHAHAAERAYHDRDFGAFRAQLLAQRTEVGAMPRLDYDLAVAEARLGNPERAMEWLSTFADMGLWQDVARDSDLASLRGTPAYARVLERLAGNRGSVANGAAAFTLADADLLPEDIAYDSVGRRFFISSVHRGKIITVDRSGVARDFTAAGANGVWAMLALAIDLRHDVLWATTVALRAGPNYDPADSGRSALLAYDISTGQRLARIEPPAAAGGHALGDMTISGDGTVYVSDGASGAVYAAGPGSTPLTVIEPPGTFTSPQSPALSADGRRLFVADYARGVAVIDLATRAVSWLPHPGNVAVTGIDGLYCVKAALIALQNGTTPNRVLRLDLDQNMTRIVGAGVLERGAPALDDPTHGVLVGDSFYYIARSGWSRVRPDGTFAPGGAADAPAVRRLVLPR